MPHPSVQSRGHLNPGDAEVAFDRFRIGLHDLVRHVWIARWNIPAGVTRPQRVLSYPAFNAVFEPAGANLFGPGQTLFVKELAGRSWVVGVMFQPAAAPLLTSTHPNRMPARGEPIVGPVHRSLVAALEDPEVDRDTANRSAESIVYGWLRPLAERVDSSGLLANAVVSLAEERSDVSRVSELAALTGVSERTLARVVRRHLGVTPKWLIERRRLQLAATRLFASPETDLADLAAELGYADQAHFTRRYAAVLGETPARTRLWARQRREAPAAHAGSN